MLSIRDANADDAVAISHIYNHYVTTTTISFEEIAVTASEMSQRIIDGAEKFPWLVIAHDGVVEGFAYASPWRVRSAYRFSVEISVYLAPSAIGRGLGARLYENLLDRLRKLGVHAVIAGIALPNELSIHLHEKMGFRKLAHFEQVGFKNGQWIDVGYWQQLL